MPEIQDKYQEPFTGDPIALSEEVKFEKKDLPEMAPSSNESVSKEQEILELEKKLAEKKQELNKEPEPKVEKIEKPKEEKVPMAEPSRILDPEDIGKKPVEQEVVPSAPASKLSSKVSTQIKKLKELDKKNQVKELCKLSFSEDLDFAVNVAEGLNNAYILDEFHDALVDELYDKLIEKGTLKKM